MSLLPLSCESLKGHADIPALNIDYERPTLVNIEEDSEQAYLKNIMLLINYAEELENYIDVQKEYIVLLLKYIQ